MADARDVTRLAALLGEGKAELVARLVAQCGFFSRAGENIGSCAIECRNSDVDSMIKVGGVVQEYEEYQVLEFQGREALAGATCTLSPSRMVVICDGHEEGLSHEESVSEHADNLHFCVLGKRLKSETLQVWGS